LLLCSDRKRARPPDSSNDGYPPSYGSVATVPYYDQGGSSVGRSLNEPYDYQKRYRTASASAPVPNREAPFRDYSPLGPGRGSPGSYDRRASPGGSGSNGGVSEYRGYSGPPTDSRSSSYGTNSFDGYGSSYGNFGRGKESPSSSYPGSSSSNAPSYNSTGANNGSYHYSASRDGYKDNRDLAGYYSGGGYGGGSSGNYGSSGYGSSGGYGGGSGGGYGGSSSTNAYSSSHSSPHTSWNHQYPASASSSYYKDRYDSGGSISSAEYRGTSSSGSPRTPSAPKPYSAASVVNSNNPYSNIYGRGRMPPGPSIYQGGGGGGGGAGGNNFYSGSSTGYSSRGIGPSNSERPLFLPLVSSSLPYYSRGSGSYAGLPVTGSNGTATIPYYSTTASSNHYNNGVSVANKICSVGSRFGDFNARMTSIRDKVDRVNRSKQLMMLSSRGPQPARSATSSPTGRIRPPLLLTVHGSAAEARKSMPMPAQEPEATVVGNKEEPMDIDEEVNITPGGDDTVHESLNLMEIEVKRGELTGTGASVHTFADNHDVSDLDDEVISDVDECKQFMAYRALKHLVNLGLHPSSTDAATNVTSLFSKYLCLPVNPAECESMDSGSLSLVESTTAIDSKVVQVPSSAQSAPLSFTACSPRPLPSTPHSKPNVSLASSLPPNGSTSKALNVNSSKPSGGMTVALPTIDVVPATRAPSSVSYFSAAHNALPPPPPPPPGPPGGTPRSIASPRA
jgi:hypothetical protein